MDISKIDNNFKSQSGFDDSDLIWIDGLKLNVYGLSNKKSGEICRLSNEVMKSYNENFRILATNTAGARIRFNTNSKKVAVRVELSYEVLLPHMPLLGTSGVDIMVNGEFYKSVRPESQHNLIYDGFLEKTDSPDEITVNLPLYNSIKNIYIGIENEAQIKEPIPYKIQDPIVYYGSSITQGACASRPSNCYTSMVSNWLNADHINLGFSGNALGEEVLAKYIAGLKMSAFVLDFDHNAQKSEQLTGVHERFFKIVREKNPGLPILILTRSDDYPNLKLVYEFREIILKTYKNAVDNGDKNVYFVDGREMFEKKDRHFCTVDCVHPNDIGFYRMANAVYPVLKEALGV